VANAITNTTIIAALLIRKT